jgi:hypothetical protein
MPITTIAISDKIAILLVIVMVVTAIVFGCHQLRVNVSKALMRLVLDPLLMTRIAF